MGYMAIEWWGNKEDTRRVTIREHDGKAEACPEVGVCSTYYWYTLDLWERRPGDGAFYRSRQYGEPYYRTYTAAKRWMCHWQRYQTWVCHYKGYTPAKTRKEGDLLWGTLWYG